MRSNRKILAGAGLLAAVLLVYGLYTVSRNLSNSAQVALTPTPSSSSIQPVAATRGRIAVAAVDIPERSIITRDMLRWKDGFVGNNAPFVTDLDSQAIGYITRVPIPKGASIRPANDFVGHLTETGIAGALRPGTRAFSLAIPNKPTLHDLVRIGNSVDVLASFDSQEARTIVQNVRVLAVDVSANDFPNVNAAMRGPFKADPKGRTQQEAVASGQVQIGPDGQPVPTPLPTQLPAGAPRPDASLTLEVTPQQAAAIQLAQQSNAAVDFLVRPALPGNRSAEAVLVGAEGSETGTGAATGGATGAAPRAISVIKSQIAPYAERKKNQGAARSGGSSGGGTTREPRFDAPAQRPLQIRDVGPVPTIPSPGPVGGDPGVTTPPAPVPAGPPPTYEIPIYADGKVVRTETVRTPQE